MGFVLWLWISYLLVYNVRMDSVDNYEKCILGIDYGTKYIGLAIAKKEVVMPLAILRYKKNHVTEHDSIQKIVDFIKSEQCDLIVIGIPLINKRKTKMGKNVLEFVENLKSALGIENLGNINIKFVDESKTSKEGVKKAVELGISKKRRKQDHGFAACEIISRFINENK